MPMNLQPDDQKTTQEIENEKALQKVLDDQSKILNYTIFVRINDVSYQKKIQLSQDATIEEAIYKAVDFDDPRFSQLSFDDLYFYMSSKKGTPKEYFPPMDKSQKIAQVNYQRFVITLASEAQPQIEQIASDQTGPSQTFCYCFTKKKEQSNFFEGVQLIIY